MPSLDDAPLTYPLVDGRQFATTIWLAWLTTSAEYATALSLAAETAARIAADSAESAARIAGIAAEASARTAAIFAELSARNTAIAAAVATEAAARIAALATHVAAADPHPVYQKESEKDAASGYAGLTAGGLILGSQILYGADVEQACQGQDYRLANARTPLPHGATHGPSGDDPVDVDIPGGASGSFTTADPFTVTVFEGRITDIS